MIRSLRVGLLLLALILLMAHPCLSQSRLDTYPLDEVRAGQQAVAKSVFRGTRIESFHVEIIGVLREFDGTRSLILGRVLDGPVVARNSGVIGGMSGSPVYIDGRLVGAIALTWPWSREPIAGITPIEDMLAAWQTAPSGVSEPTSASGGPLASPLRVEDTVIRRVNVAPMPPVEPDPPGVMTLVPLGGFMQVSGFNRRGLERVSELLSPYGLHVVQGPGGTEDQLTPALVPGAALGAQLVRGDFDMTALGTVTLVEGDRVLGFGHPLFELGEIDVPMTGGYVHDILPSLHVSNKIMSATQVVGRIYRDHQCAIAGVRGEQADMLPVTIEVTDRDSARSRTFEIEVARIRQLLPALVATSVVTAVDETRGRVSRGTARFRIDIEIEGRPALHREDAGYSEGDAALASLPVVLGPLALFTDNPFGEVRMNGVRISVETEDTRRTAAIERVTVAQSRIEAGDEVTLSVRVRPHGRSLEEVPVQLSLPPDLPTGQVRVVVSGGASADEARQAIGAPRPLPVSLDQLVDRYLSADGASDLIVQARLPRAGVSLLGEELPQLPVAAQQALQAVNPTDLRPAPSVVKVVVPTEWVLTGRQMVTLHVESRVAAGAPAGPEAPPAEGPPEQPEPEENEASSYGGRGEAVEVRGAQLLPAGVELAGRNNRRERGVQAAEEEGPEPPTRAPEVWVHQTRDDFAAAETENVAVDVDGGLSLSLSHAELARLPADVIWSIAVHDGEVYVGTGCDGLVYRLSDSGEPVEFFATGEMNVHALAFDNEGNLYAATSPQGRLFRIAPDGTGRLVYDSESAYLWCLVIGPEGTVYAGGGAPARIYAVRPDGQSEVLAELPAANVLSLVRGSAGELFAGTSEAGVIYRAEADRTVRALCQLSGTSVDALVIDEDGDLYAAASPGGNVYRIPSDGLADLYCETGQQVIHGLGAISGGDLIAATGPDGILVRAAAEGEPEAIFRPEAGIATALAVSDGAVYVGSSGPSVVRRFGPEQAAVGSVESTVLDAGRPARWGRVDLTATAPEGAEVRVETRSGNSPDPEDHWSSWSPALQEVITSRPSRYLQYRLRIAASVTGVTPTVQQVRISYRSQNRAPACSLSALEAGDRISGTVDITWQARDPDRDTLSYQAAVSTDLAESWEELKAGLTETTYEWDTTERDDGRYLLRVTASDVRSVPEDPRTAEDTVIVWVDNTAPQVMLFRTSVSVGEDRRVQATGMASDATSPVRSVEYRVDEGEWSSLPLPAIEASLTDFSVATDALAVGEHKIEVRAFDGAGNLATDSVQVTVAEGTSEATVDSAGEAVREP